MEFRFGGRWTILSGEEENIYDGQLTLNDQEGLISLEIYHFDPKRERMFANILIPKHIESIRGVLSNGALITLMDCTVYSRSAEVFSKNTITLTAKYALNGVNIKTAEEAVFTKFVFDLSNITDWADLNRFETKYNEDSNYSIEYKEESSVTLLEEEGMKIVLEPYYLEEHKKDDRGKITISKAVKVILEFENSCTYERALTEVHKIINLVSFGTGNKVDIIKLQAFNIELKYIAINENTVEKPIDIFTNYSYNDFYPQKHPYLYLFNLGHLVNEHKNSVIKWFDNYDKMEPVIELYLDLFRYNMTPERAFLNIMQALETYHTRFKASNITEYKRRVHEIVYDCPEYTKAQHLKYLFGDAQKGKGHILLKSRLCDLFLTNFEIVFMDGYKTQYDFIEKAVITRNYFTHYGERKKNKVFTNEKLEISIYWLKTVLEYHLLKELELTQEYMQEKVGQKTQNIENIFSPY